MRTLLLLIGLILSLTTSVYSQDQLRIEGKAKLLSGELIDNSIRDVNGSIAAAIKIKTDLTGFSVESNNGVIKMNTKPGEYLVFLSPTERVLTIRKTGYISLKILLPEQDIRLKSGQVWEIIVTADKKLEQVPVNFIVIPEDATLSVDEVPQKAPYKGLLLAIGKHTVVIKKAGFATQTLPIEVSISKNLFEINLKQVELEALTLRSEPEGATIFIDGLEKGKTPKGLFIYPGNYTVKWNLSGYADVEQQIEVKEKGKNEFSVKLEKNSGLIIYKVNPTDAIVKLNSEISKNATNEVLPGNYKITIEKSGYVSQTDSVDLIRGQTINKAYNLEKNTGLISWQTIPANATVSINKEVQSLKTQAELAPGRYLVEITAAGYDGTSESVELKRGDKLQKKWQLIQQKGSLQFSVEPVDAKVSLKINGQVVETWNGLKILRDIAVGEYEIKAELSGFQTTSERIIISKNKTIVKEMVLIKGAPIGVSIKNSIGMELVLIPSGTFQMGENRSSHEVIISQPFYMGKYEVTQKEWKAVMGTNPSKFKGDNLPVERVSWNDIQGFVKKLNQKEGTDKYRLPTEAEWEYSCRTGTTTKWSFGDDENKVSDYAWFSSNSNAKTHEVGQKKPNQFGLYDMHGNVWEWVQDRYGNYSSEKQTDPQGSITGWIRVIRGGSWEGDAEDMRSANRLNYYPESTRDFVGFRLLRLQ